MGREHTQSTIDRFPIAGSSLIMLLCSGREASLSTGPVAVWTARGRAKRFTGL